MRRSALTALVVVAGLIVPASTWAQPGSLGVEVPQAARDVLAPAEQVEGICATTRWRALELFAALDAVADHRPAVVAALSDAGLDYVLPDPEEYRVRAEAALDGVCGAPTVDMAIASIDDLVSVHQDMEAGYGAIEEAMRPLIDERVENLSETIRPEVDAWVEEERANVEVHLRSEAQEIADAIVEEERPALEAQLQGEATSLAQSGLSEAEVRSAIEARIASLQVEAEADLSKRVEQALANRIVEERARIEAGAEALAEELVGVERTKLDALEEPLTRMKDAVATAVQRARGADSPERRTAIEVRLRLAMKVVGVRLDEARALVERARPQLQALHASDPAELDADGLLAAMNEERARLETRLRSALEADDHTAFTAATVGFQEAWQEIARHVDAATATWTSTQVCEQAVGSIDSAVPQVEQALARVREASSAQGEPTGSSIEIAEALRAADADLSKYLEELRALQDSCRDPGDRDPRDLIESLDLARMHGERARATVEDARALAGGSR